MILSVIQGLCAVLLTAILLGGVASARDRLTRAHRVMAALSVLGLSSVWVRAAVQASWHTAWLETSAARALYSVMAAAAAVVAAAVATKAWLATGQMAAPADPRARHQFRMCLVFGTAMLVLGGSGIALGLTASERDRELFSMLAGPWFPIISIAAPVVYGALASGAAICAGRSRNRLLQILSRSEGRFMVPFAAVVLVFVLYIPAVVWVMSARGRMGPAIPPQLAAATAALLLMQVSSCLVFWHGGLALQALGVSAPEEPKGVR